MPDETALTIQTDWDPIIDLVTQSVDSVHSKRAYSRALIAFLDWHQQNGRPPLSKAVVNAYREALLESGVSRSSINQALSAIRKLAAEAADNGLIPPTLAMGIERVKGVKQEGVRAGNWLTKEQAQQLVNFPIRLLREEEITPLKAVRDQALLAVMLGSALRRAEVASLTWAHIQQRDGRWAIIDLVGKRGRVRSVGLAAWIKVALDQWQRAAGRENGRVFLAINKGGKLAGAVKTKGGTTSDGTLTSQAIYNILKGYAEQLDFGDLGAHDLRRTAAALALRGGADLRQIQQMLGHASIMTTEKYLEPIRSLQVTAGDFIQLELL